MAKFSKEVIFKHRVFPGLPTTKEEKEVIKAANQYLWSTRTGCERKIYSKGLSTIALK